MAKEQFQLAYKASKKFNRAKNNIKKGNLILVMRPKERYFSTILDSRIKAPQMLDYHYDCMNMVECLNQEVKSNLILRLHEEPMVGLRKLCGKINFLT